MPPIAPPWCCIMAGEPACPAPSGLVWANARADTRSTAAPAVPRRRWRGFMGTSAGAIAGPYAGSADRPMTWIIRRADAALLQPGAQRHDLPGEHGHEILRQLRVGLERGEQRRFGEHPHPRWRIGIGVAVIDVREQRRFREQLSGARGVERDAMIV